MQRTDTVPFSGVEHPLADSLLCSTRGCVAEREALATEVRPRHNQPARRRIVGCSVSCTAAVCHRDRVTKNDTSTHGCFWEWRPDANLCVLHWHDASPNPCSSEWWERRRYMCRVDRTAYDRHCTDTDMTDAFLMWPEWIYVFVGIVDCDFLWKGTIFYRVHILV